MSVPSIFDITYVQIGGFLLVLSRMTGIFFLTPVIGSRNIPIQVRIGISLFLAFATYPFVVVPASLGLESPLLFAGNIIKELFVGLLIGYIGLLFFSAVLIAGQVIDMQMGFGLVNVIDPLSQTQVPVMGQFKYLIAMLIFLMVNGHHWFLLAVTRSFEIIPVGGLILTSKLSGAVISAFGEVLLMSIKIAFPILGTLLIVDVCLGILARTMPQMNVFIVGFPLKIAVGLAIFVAVLPLLSNIFFKLFEKMHENIYIILKLAV